MDENEMWMPRARVRLANRHALTCAQHWGPRRSEDCQWILVLAGALRYTHGRLAALDVPAGHLLFIPGGEQHVLQVIAAGAMTGFHGEWMDQGTWRERAYTLPIAWHRVTRLSDAAPIGTLMTRMAELFAGFDPRRDYRLRGLATEVLLTLAAAWACDGGRPVTRRTDAMVAWIRRRIPQPVDRQDLARHFGLTPDYVNQVFKRELGQSTGWIVARERCALAYQHLRDGANVTAAAARAGYDDPFHFSRVFKRVYGISPKQARF